MIETMIYTSALALTAFGVIEIQKGKWKGYITLLVGMGLEFIKYWGRNKN